MVSSGHAHCNSGDRRTESISDSFSVCVSTAVVAFIHDYLF